MKKQLFVIAFANARTRLGMIKIIFELAGHTTLDSLFGQSLYDAQYFFGQDLGALFGKDFDLKLVDGAPHLQQVREDIGKEGVIGVITDLALVKNSFGGLPKSAPDEVPSGVIIAAAAVREGLPVVVIQDESGSEKYSRLLKVLGVPVARNVEHAAELLLQLTQEPVPV